MAARRSFIWSSWYLPLIIKQMAHFFFNKIPVWVLLSWSIRLFCCLFAVCAGLYPQSGDNKFQSTLLSAEVMPVRDACSRFSHPAPIKGWKTQEEIVWKKVKKKKKKKGRRNGFWVHLLVPHFNAYILSGLEETQMFYFLSVLKSTSQVSC